MSEQLRARGYMNSAGVVRGDAVGNFESFIVGDVTLKQLAKAGVIPSKTYGALSNRKPDGLVVDKREDTPNVRLVVEHKDRGELSTPSKIKVILDKVADIYCQTLGCNLFAVTDGQLTVWACVAGDGSYSIIEREDGFVLDHSADAHDEASRKALARLLAQMDESLDWSTGRLITAPAANPTQLADRVWQAVWLASGANPDACLATFIEVLLFKFLSDLSVLTVRDGVKVDFDHVRTLNDSDILVYYSRFVRPAIKSLFPANPDDGTSVINGTVLDPKNVDHGRLFARVLSDFNKFGNLRRISPEFKSRIFERFLRNTISQKNWGQYFTPRNVVKAIVEMSAIEHLPPSSVVCDPASGVGGFVLEPLINKRPTDFRGGEGLRYRGLDRDPKTVILAKANMLIHLSDLLEEDPHGSIALLAKSLNETFASMDRHISGSLATAPDKEYDLVLSNPPYVVAGTTQQKAMLSAEQKYADYYDTPSMGVEGLFMQLIIKGLKASGRAFVVVPDGLLFRHGDSALREFILKQCELEAVVSLPKNTFYTTSKKTYILALRKKQSVSVAQVNPVFTYLISSVGETLDSKRFSTDDNDLPQMAEQFRIFAASPSGFTSGDNLRCRVQPIDMFRDSESWVIDHWWTDAELERLGAIDSQVAVTPSGLSERLRDMVNDIGSVESALQALPAIKPVFAVKDVALDSPLIFSLSIGRRVTQKQLRDKITAGDVPLYSANVREPFAMVNAATLPEGCYSPGSFDNASIIWGLDGDWATMAITNNDKFAITDHCGRIELKNDKVDAEYIAAAVYRAGARVFNREFRPSMKRLAGLSIQIPITEDGEFDLEAQQQLAARAHAVERAKRAIETRVEAALDVIPEPFMTDVQEPDL
jgi:type I restriction enzyme M protein